MFRSVAALEAAIESAIARHNADPKPFARVADADAILDRVKRVCERTSDSGHQHDSTVADVVYAVHGGLYFLPALSEVMAKSALAVPPGGTSNSLSLRECHSGGIGST